MAAVKDSHREMRSGGAKEQHMTDHEFTGKIAVVAGGSLGMGRAAARLLAERGAQVVICGRRDKAVRQAVAEMQLAGLQVEGIPADVGKSADVEHLVNFTLEHFGGVDILVNSAGIQRYGTVVD